MKKFMSLLLLGLIVVSCNKKEDGPTRIAGKIENIDTDSVYIYNDSYRKAIAVVNQEFSDTMHIDAANYFTLKMGNESTQIFLHPSDSLHVSVNGNEFDESLKYSGTAAEENNYLAADYLTEEKVMADPAQVFGLEATAYKAKLKELKDASNKALMATKSSDQFKELQKKNNEARYLMMLVQYPEAYPYFTNQPAQFPPEFMDEVKYYDLNNEQDFLVIPNYRELVLMGLTEKLHNIESPEDMEGILNSIQSQKIKDNLLGSMLYEISGHNPEAQTIHDLIVNHSKDEKIVQKAKNKMATIQAILPGQPSPKFTYTDIHGKSVSLDQFKGKLVYIDVWATWCGPCIKEIPSLKQLEADFHGKAVEFVSISIDVKRDFEKWQNFVAEKDLRGIQLFADKDWKSEFIQAYGIDAIPRFILIDKAGNIINSDAPRPSEPQIRELLQANL